MHAIAYESIDKKTRTFYTIKDPIPFLKTDNGLVEAISLSDPNNYIRVFFDVDEYNVSNDPIQQILEHISIIFKCHIDDWGIATCHRDTKLSYHIVSKLFSIKISHLRNITNQLRHMFPCIDEKVLYFSITDYHECSYLRLPNQTKFRINKVAPPLTIINGELNNFIITHIDNLVKLS